MRIAINGRFLAQHTTGVQRVAYNFSHELFLMTQKENINLTVYSPQEILQNNWAKNLPLHTLESAKPETLFWEQCQLPKIVKKNKEFLLNFGNVAPLFNKNQAVMIHDMAVFHKSSWFSKSFSLWYRFVLPKVARSSKFIMTVSEFSKSEIIKYCRVHQDKILVLPLWLNEEFNSQLTHPILKKDSYVLTVASLDPRKNYKTLLRSFIKMNSAEYNLYAVGGYTQHFSKDPELHAYSNHEKITFLGRCNDSELINLYKKASCYCNMSYYEGFGLTALEAMACSCPLLLSDIPAHREVCGDAALYADPNDENDIQQKLKQLLHDPALQQDLIQRGHQRVRQFTKESSVQKLWGLLKTLHEV